MRAYLALGLFAAAVASTDLALATDPPDAELNPVTGYIELVDIAIASGARVRHTVDMRDDGVDVTLVSSAAGMSPRLAIKPNGDSWVVWWKASTGEVFYRVRDVATDTWSSEEVVSSEGEDSRYPEIAHDGTATWIAWEVHSSSSTWIVASGISDDPEPFPVRTAIGMTTFGGDIDVRLHVEEGHVWVTWVDSANEVGWSEYDEVGESWGTSEFESYLGTTISTARSSIRAAVLGE